MSDPVTPLVLDLLEWLGPAPRPYSEVMEVWRTSCPRLPVWETANELGWLDHLHPPGSVALVAVSAKGRRQLAAQRSPRHGSVRPRRAGSAPDAPAVQRVRKASTRSANLP